MKNIKYGLFIHGRLAKSFDDPVEAFNYAALIYEETKVFFVVRQAFEPDLKDQIIVQFGVYNGDGKLITPYSCIYDAKERAEKDSLIVKCITQTTRS